MATTVLDYMKKLKSINVELITKKVVDENSEEIVKVNRDNLDLGLDREEKLVGSYKQSTENIAAALKKSGSSNAPKTSKRFGSKYTFYWTGSFWEGIFITFDGKLITFDSTGKNNSNDALGFSKQSKLSFIDENRLLGINNKRDVEYINFDIILPDMQEKIKKILSK